MQIREIILYGKNGLVRKLDFNIGEVNIISGKSKTGKSAIGDIIDYCLGGQSCKIAFGVVRDTVEWYGLLLQLENERIFVARKNPPEGQQTTSYAYIEIGEILESPEAGTFSTNTNSEGIEKILSERIGIVENLNIPKDGESRQALQANIRHALYYSFQKQDEIAAKAFLFHKQSEDFITQAIKDTFPFFLGIIDNQVLAMREERKILRRQLVIKNKQYNEIRSIQGNGTDKALSLLSEAKAIGLINKDFHETEDFNLIKNELETVNLWTPAEVNLESMDRISFLQVEYSRKMSEIDEIGEKISYANTYVNATSSYIEESKQQKMRLQSIGLFDNISFEKNSCPFCNGKIEGEIPNAEAIRKAIVNLNENIKNASKNSPNLRGFINGMEEKRQQLREQLISIKAEIDGIYTQNEESEKIRELNSRSAKVVGRISLWLESISNPENTHKLENDIDDIIKQIEELDKQLDENNIEDRKASILSRISSDMSLWAKELKLEHCEYPFRLDMNKVTVVVDIDRPVTLDELGSGANWVGIHLITYFALHKYFIENNRPIPRFIFLDQPSQVYFPSDLESDIDHEEVIRLYSFIFNRVNEMKGSFQAIVVDHANLKNEKFQNHVIESWWDGEKLVPESWYNK